jgi:aryl-alcohol dehydrogenase-like predicted oxidoreductase
MRMTAGIGKLALGTAQFGLAYGATGPAMRPEECAAIAVLEAARAAGIDTLDTAAAYGDAEARIGRWLQGRGGVRIVTKLAIGAEYAPTGLRDALRRSLDRLGVAQVEAVLLHDPDVLRGDTAREVVAALERVRGESLCRRIGVSVYDAADLEAALAVFAPEMVQLPLNLVDQRLAVSGWIERLAARGIEVHARSVFLQGVLLSPRERLPPYFARLAPHLAGIDAAAEAAGANRLEACLAYVLRQPGMARAAIGVQSLAELEEILAAARRAPSLALDFAGFAAEDPLLLDPRRWPPREALRASNLQPVQAP